MTVSIVTMIILLQQELPPYAHMLEKAELYPSRRHRLLRFGSVSKYCYSIKQLEKSKIAYQNLNQNSENKTLYILIFLYCFQGGLMGRILSFAALVCSTFFVLSETASLKPACYFTFNCHKDGKDIFIHHINWQLMAFISL